MSPEESAPILSGEATQPVPPPGPRSCPVPFQRFVPLPRPNFWSGLLWCLAFVIVTQLPGAIVAAVIVLVHALTTPGAASAFTSPTALFETPVGINAMAVAFLINEFLVIGMSLVVIRLMVGRGWRDQLGLHRPSLAHVVLAVASLPGLVVLANAVFAWLASVLPDVPALPMALTVMANAHRIASECPVET